MIKLSFSILIIFLTYPLTGQNRLYYDGEEITGSYDNIIEYQKDYLLELYAEQVGYKDQMINGRDYYPYYYRSKLKPLFYIDKKRSSSIVLNGRKYSGLILQYDTYMDEVIYSDNTRNFNNRLYQIALNKNLVDGFELYFAEDSLIFRHFRYDEALALNLKAGFYETAYEGESKYIIKHQSAVYERNGIDEYFYKPEYYVSFGGVFTRIKSSRTFINLFADRSEEVKRYMRVNRIDIRKANKNQVIRVLRYYDNMILAGGGAR